MLSGEWHPGQLQIVREILSGGQSRDFDTAKFSGAAANYSFAVNGTATTLANLRTAAVAAVQMRS